MEKTLTIMLGKKRICLDRTIQESTLANGDTVVYKHVSGYVTGSDLRRRNLFTYGSTILHPACKPEDKAS